MLTVAALVDSVVGAAGTLVEEPARLDGSGEAADEAEPDLSQPTRDMVEGGG